jgi:hypothetical protein
VAANVECHRVPPPESNALLGRRMWKRQMHHRERHRSERMGWLRAAVLGDLLQKIFWPHSIVVMNWRTPQHLVWSVNFCNRSAGPQVPNKLSAPVRDSPDRRALRSNERPAGDGHRRTSRKDRGAYRWRNRPSRDQKNSSIAYRKRIRDVMAHLVRRAALLLRRA